MASKPRNFVKDVPIHIANRCVLRTNLLESEDVRTMVKLLLAKHARKCRVRVLQYAIRCNHLHLLISQDFTGHDRRRKLGVAAFCRNVFSAAARFGHIQSSTAGRFWERTYRSCLRGEGQEALQAFAYIAANGLHHNPDERLEDNKDSGNRVYLEGKPDGVITHVLGVFAPLTGNTRERGAFIRDLILEWHSLADEKRKEVATARTLLCQHSDHLDHRGGSQAVPVGEWIDPKSVEDARRKLLSWVPKRVKFHPRRAPKLGETIRIVIEEIPPAPRAGVGWREIAV